MFKAWTLKKSPGNPKVVKFPQQWACSPLLLLLFCRFLFVCFCLMARGILLFFFASWLVGSYFLTRDSTQGSQHRVLTTEQLGNALLLYF